MRRIFCSSRADTLKFKERNRAGVRCGFGRIGGKEERGCGFGMVAEGLDPLGAFLGRDDSGEEGVGEGLGTSVVRQLDETAVEGEDFGRGGWVEAVGEEESGEDGAGAPIEKRGTIVKPANGQDRITDATVKTTSERDGNPHKGLLAMISVGLGSSILGWKHIRADALVDDDVPKIEFHGPALRQGDFHS